MKNIGKRIKELRKKNNLTQDRLAEYLGVTDKAVSKWECGITMPDLALIVPLSRILHVSADELLSGKPAEKDERRSEFDSHCERFMDYAKTENYELALQAVKEYPDNYKYIVWLAEVEMEMAYNPKYKEDASQEYSLQMMEHALTLNNLVIEECADEKLREKAIWNALHCCKRLKRSDDARKYAEMFPVSCSKTRYEAMAMCFEGAALVQYRKSRVDGDLDCLLRTLAEIYWFENIMSQEVESALDTTEAILKTVIPDENYLGYYRYLCCVYQKRAEFAVVAGECDQAMEYLRIMFTYAKKIPGNTQKYTCGVLADLQVDFTANHILPYLFIGLDDPNKSVLDQLKNRVKHLPVFSPLWERDDFNELVNAELIGKLDI